MKESNCRTRLAIIICGLFCFLSTHIKVFAIHDTFSPEYQNLIIIENVSKPFRKKLEQILFTRGFVSVDNREALSRMAQWVKDNKYSRIAEFLDSLEENDVNTLFAIFSVKQTVGSTPFLPVVESVDITGQETVLAFPFKGEFFVVQGNSGWVSHKKGTNNEYSWDFVIQHEGGMVTGDSGKNVNYLAWGQPVLAPADGIVRKIRNDQEDHPPLTTQLNKSNFVMIDHGFGEISNIHHLMKGSIIVKEGTRVKRGDILGKIGDSGISMFPHIHYELDRGNADKPSPGASRFACYFAKHKGEETWSLEISGIPREGDYLMSVDDYMYLLYGEKTLLNQ